MDTGRSVSHPGPADPLAHPNICPRHDLHLVQVRHRHLDPNRRLDGDRLHARHRPGESHDAAYGSSNRGATLVGEIDAPMTGVLACRRIAGDERPIYWSEQTRGCQCEDVEHSLPLPVPTYRGCFFDKRGSELTSALQFLEERAHEHNTSWADGFRAHRSERLSTTP